MRITPFRSLLYIFLFLLSLLFAQPAFAHGNEPRLEISMERLNPGGVVEVRGVDFDYDEPVVLSLTRSEIRIPLVEVTADAEGVFTQIIVLPVDLPAGEYHFLARSDHHMVTSPTITVSGAALLDQEDSGIRDQSDLQLGIVPTLAPGVSSTPLPTVAPIETTPPETSTMPLVWFASGIGILLLFGLILLRVKR